MKRYLAFFSCLGLLLLGPGIVLAHSAEDSLLQLFNVPAGAYYLSVWTYPSILRVGNIHIAVEATSEHYRPDSNTLVKIEFVSLTKTNQIQVAHALFNGNQYEAELKIAEIGPYRVNVIVTDPAGQSSTNSFEVEVRSVRLLQGLIIILLAQIILVTIWWARESVRTWLRR